MIFIGIRRVFCRRKSAPGIPAGSQKAGPFFEGRVVQRRKLVPFVSRSSEPFTVLGLLSKFFGGSLAA